MGRENTEVRKCKGCAKEMTADNLNRNEKAEQSQGSGRTNPNVRTAIYIFREKYSLASKCLGFAAEFGMVITSKLQQVQSDSLNS
jgi:hypothetical protein